MLENMVKLVTTNILKNYQLTRFLSTHSRSWLFMKHKVRIHLICYLWFIDNDGHKRGSVITPMSMHNPLQIARVDPQRRMELFR